MFEYFAAHGALEAIIVLRNVSHQIVRVPFDLAANVAAERRRGARVCLYVPMQIQFAGEGTFANWTTETNMQFVFGAFVLSQFDLTGKRFLAHAALLRPMELRIMNLK